MPTVANGEPVACTEHATRACRPRSCRDQVQRVEADPRRTALPDGAVIRPPGTRVPVRWSTHRSDALLIATDRPCPWAGVVSVLSGTPRTWRSRHVVSGDSPGRAASVPGGRGHDVTSAPTAHHSTPASASADDRSESVRLELKPVSTSPTGFVDGAWWPRSHDLEAELSAVVPVLADRRGSVERVSYQLSDWGTAARVVKAGGGLVRLSGFRSQTAGTIDVLGPRRRVTLLVVPAETSPQIAHDALVTASRHDNADTVGSLLGSAA